MLLFLGGWGHFYHFQILVNLIEKKTALSFAMYAELWANIPERRGGPNGCLPSHLRHGNDSVFLRNKNHFLDEGFEVPKKG